MIRVPVVNVVFDGKMLGEMTTDKAIELAKEQGLDLVEVAPNQKPPVCKIMSYSKFKYEEKKKAKKGKIKGKTKELKEMRFAPLIGEGDLQHKLKRVREFLEKGHKVKLTIFFKGRIPADAADVLVKKLLTELEEISTIEQPLKKEGRRWFFTVVYTKKQNTNDKITEDKTDAKIQNKENSSKKAENKEGKDS